jgi:(4S)-4-hydroxy-5-phosphonooxypentane-2,3-dione isomerase
MSTTFIAKLVVKPGQEATIEQLQTELSQIAHAEEPDVLVYDFIKHRTEPQTYVVYARFTNEAAFDAHMKAPFHDRLVPPILASLAKDMDLQFFDWIA